MAPSATEWHKARASESIPAPNSCCSSSCSPSPDCRAGLEDAAREGTHEVYSACECHLLTETTPKVPPEPLEQKIPGRNSHWWQEVSLPMAGGGSTRAWRSFQPKLFVILCFPTAPGGMWARSRMRLVPPQKENIPVLAVQDPSRTDHILFMIAPSPARVCYLKTAAGTNPSSQ